MIADYKEFINHVIVEELHPELKEIVQAQGRAGADKQSRIAKKIKELTLRGKSTGIEGNMPRGSSRAFLRHSGKHEIHLDGKPVKISTGTKVAIRSTLDRYHDHEAHAGMSLGAMQNMAEGGDHWSNKTYRILTHNGEAGHHYTTNHDYGIFPPLLDHDHENHEWSHVGTARDIKAGEFRSLTKNHDYPKGISHEDFHMALTRQHDKNNGKYWSRHSDYEEHMDKVTDHPLVQKFLDYHNNTGHPPHDYSQQKNLGVFEHPDGSKHIVARDHGYDTGVMHAYQKAQQKKYRG